ncbi:ABC transporter ATP-binding protein [Cypionkella psychrotolerans]|uniref:ABC transporter ATP-binding protein n=1 Tax=Cypionkella psychrotolerans TaxID=1678131 RepID=UPI000A57A7CE|nr:ABC transporter ATP-binding protein [Cypionkella psychrotolerans]
MASVELQNISKVFGGLRVIDNLNLTVPDGSFTALLGPSGCGKSALLRMIAGLEQISEGRALIGGVDITNEEPARRKVAMVFQSYALYPHLTVEENVCFSLSLAGMPKAAQKERAAGVAKMLQLESLMARRPAQLSGGQRQRVAIGRALARNPEVFLFDEPLSNLDAMLRVQMRLELTKLHKDLKTTMIYVTHDQVEAMTLADQIVVLEKGKIQQVGSPWQLYNQPANRFVASFIGSLGMNFLPARATPSGQGATVALGDSTRIDLPLRMTAAQPVELGIRPEHLHLVAAGTGDIAGKALLVEYLGNTSYAYIESAFGQVIVEADGSESLETGPPWG